MASLQSLFDFQKIDNNSELASLIEDTEKRYSRCMELSEDELDMVAGGISQENTKKKKPIIKSTEDLK